MKPRTQKKKAPGKTRKQTAATRGKTGLPQAGGKYKLRLYVTGATGRSTAAVANLKSLCEQHLPGNYELEIVDIYQKPELVKEQQLIAAPTLVKEFPLPLRKFIGDMSNTERLLAGLEVSKG